MEHHHQENHSSWAQYFNYIFSHLEVNNSNLGNNMFGNPLDYNVAVIKGISGSGKTTIVKSFAKYFATKFPTKILCSNSMVHFLKSVENCIDSFNLRRQQNDDCLQVLEKYINKTQQNFCLVFEDLENEDRILGYIKRLHRLDNCGIIITTQNDHLRINFNHRQFLVDIPSDPDVIVTVHETIETKFNSLLRRDDRSWRSKCISRVLNVLPFIKSGTISQTQLINCLSGNEYSISQVKEIIGEFRSLSYLTLNDCELLSINPLVQIVAQERFDSRLEWFKYTYIFRPGQINLDFILSKIARFNEDEIGLIRNLGSDLTTQHKCNIQDMLTSLVNDIRKNGNAMRANQDVIVSLQELQENWKMKNNGELQFNITTLANEWSKIQNSDSEKSKFLTTKEKFINDLAIMLTNFGKLIVEEEFAYQNGSRWLEEIKHVLIIGPTGSGKSTIINFLIGNKLYCLNPGIFFDNSELEVIQINGNKVAEIGSTDDSQTNNITGYLNEKENTMYWDFPGLFDSHGELQRIRNAIMFQSFNTMVHDAKILLVVAVCSIFDKTDAFKNTMEMLEKLCSVDQLQSNFSVLATRCGPINGDKKRMEIKQKIVERCQSHLENSSFFQIFNAFKTSGKLAIFPRIDQEGLVNEEMFQDLHNALKTIRSSRIKFGLSLDNKTLSTIGIIGNLLNSYAANIFENSAKNKIRQTKSIIAENTFAKDKLKNIGRFSILREDMHNFNPHFDDVASEGCQSFEIWNIIEALNFLHRLNSNVSVKMAEWMKPLNDFNASFDKIVEKVGIKVCEGGLVQVSSPILSASDIKDVPLSNVETIRALCIIFICDEDLNIPGVTLFIGCKELKIIGQREICLKSDGKTENKNSGSFYGYADKVVGGKILFNLDGLDGAHGIFNPECLDPLNLQRYYISFDLHKISSFAKAITKLKSYAGESLIEKLVKNKKEQLLIYNRIADIETKIYNLNKKNANPPISPVYDNITLSEEFKMLQNVLDELRLVKKICKLNTMTSKQENSLSNSSSSTNIPEKLENIDDSRIMSFIQKLFNEINRLDKYIIEIAQMEERDAQKPLEDFELRLEEVSNLLSGFYNKFGKLPQQNEKLEEGGLRQATEKHNIFIEGLVITLSANDYNAIVNDANFGKIAESYKKELNKKLSVMMKEFFATQTDIERFKIQNLLTKETEAARNVKRIAIREKNVRFKNCCPNEYNVIWLKIHEIILCINEKEYFTRHLYETLSTHDIFIHQNGEPNKFGYFEVNDIDWEDFIKQCEIHVNEFKIQKPQMSLSGNIVKAIFDLLTIKMHFNRITARNVHGISEKNRFIYNIDKVLLADVRKYVDLLTEQKKDIIIKELEAFMGTIRKASNAIKHYETKKTSYKKWREINGQHQNSEVNDLLKEVDLYFAIDEKYKQSLKEEANIVKQIIFKQSNLVTTKELNTTLLASFDPKAASLHQHFYEKYEVTPCSEGKPGGNSGAFLFDIDYNHKYVKNKPGQGGEHSFILEGTYLRDKRSFFDAFFRRTSPRYSFVFPKCDKKDFEQRFFQENLFPKLSSFSQRTLLNANSSVSSECNILSHIIAKFNSGWLYGPCITYSGSAPDGNYELIDPNFLQECQKSFKHYIACCEKQLGAFFVNLNE